MVAHKEHVPHILTNVPCTLTLNMKFTAFYNFDSPKPSCSFLTNDEKYTFLTWYQHSCWNASPVGVHLQVLNGQEYQKSSNTPPIPPQSTIYLKTSASYPYPFWKNFNLHLSFTGWTIHLYSIWILLTADFHLPKHDETRIKDTRDFILSGSWRVPHPRSVAVPCHWVKWSSQSWTKCWRRKREKKSEFMMCMFYVNKM